MLSRIFSGALAAGMAAALVGCNDGPAPPAMAPAGGIVKYKGSPLAGATVMFIPEGGALAGGTTDVSGKFKLMTGTLDGVAVGNCKVTVTAVEPGSGGAISGGSSAPSKDDMQEKMMQATKSFIEKKSASSGPKSLIPEKYGNADTSGLSYTVEKDSSKNQFTIELN